MDLKQGASKVDIVDATKDGRKNPCIRGHIDNTRGFHEKIFVEVLTRYDGGVCQAMP